MPPRGTSNPAFFDLTPMAKAKRAPKPPKQPRELIEVPEIIADPSIEVALSGLNGLTVPTMKWMLEHTFHEPVNDPKVTKPELLAMMKYNILKKSYFYKVSFAPKQMIFKVQGDERTTVEYIMRVIRTCMTEKVMHSSDRLVSAELLFYAVPVTNENLHTIPMGMMMELRCNVVDRRGDSVIGDMGWYEGGVPSDHWQKSWLRDVTSLTVMSRAAPAASSSAAAASSSSAAAAAAEGDFVEDAEEGEEEEEQEQDEEEEPEEPPGTKASPNTNT